ncbi:acetyl-CoA carboxylase biotin carboxyl carrier protein subunit, partial [uncultured Acinetobacter sp.]
EGAQVAKGEVIAIMEAMKMEIQVTAHQAGTLQHLAQTGKTLKADEKIAEIIATS